MGRGTARRAVEGPTESECPSTMLRMVPLPTASPQGGLVMIIIGLDPGLGCTGWGVIAAEGNRLSHVANGQVRTDPRQALPARLLKLDEELGLVIEAHRPDEAAVE